MRGRRRGEGSPPYGEAASSAVGRADRGVRPYGAIRGVVRDRVGRPQGSRLRKRYKGCSARQAGDRKGRPYGGLQEVWWGRQTRGRPPLRKCVVGAGFYPAHRGAKPLPYALLVTQYRKKRDAPRRLFFVVSRLYLTCCTGPYRRQPSRQRYLRASYQQQHESPAE